MIDKTSIAIENNVYRNKDITCPYCGHKESDSWEVTGDHDGDKNEIECYECGKTFEFVTNIDVSYTSYPKENNEN